MGGKRGFVEWLSWEIGIGGMGLREVEKGRGKGEGKREGEKGRRKGEEKRGGESTFSWYGGVMV